MPNNRSFSRWLVPVVLVAELLPTVDIAIVNVALPDIRAGLHASAAASVLVSAGYTVTYASLLVFGARLGSHLGHRRMYLVGTASFALTSLACGLAPEPTTLVVARLAQGAAGAVLVPQVLSILQSNLVGAARATALSWWALVVSVGGVAGQLLGGLIIGLDLGGTSWRAVFLVNVPVGVLVLAAGAVTLPRDPVTTARPVDVRGAVLLTSAVGVIVLPLTLVQEVGWTWWVLVGLALGAGLLLASGRHLVTHPHDEAVIDVDVLRRPGIRRGGLALAAVMATYGGLLFCLTLLLQERVGLTPFGSGLAVVPFIAGFAVTSLGVDRLPGSWRDPVAVGGFGLVAVGYVLLGVADLGGTWRGGASAGALALAGAGIGLGFSHVLARAVAGVPTSNAADASGVLNTLSQVGYLVGVTAFGSWYLHHTKGPSATSAFVQVAFGLAVAALGATLLARWSLTDRVEPPPT